MTEHEKIRLFLTGKRRIPLYEVARICANESPVSEMPEKSEMVEIFESVLHTACDDGTLRYTDPYICSSVAIISLGYDKRNFYDIEIDDLREWARKNDIRCYFNDEALANGDTKLDAQKPGAESAPPETEAKTHESILWNSNNADFACLITELWEKGYIQADSPTEALRIAAPHFSGLSSNPKSLLQGKRNRDGKADRARAVDREMSGA